MEVKKNPNQTNPKLFPHSKLPDTYLTAAGRAGNSSQNCQSTDISQMFFHVYDNEKGRKSRKYRFWDIKSPMLRCLEEFRSTACSLFLSWGVPSHCGRGSVCLPSSHLAFWSNEERGHRTVLLSWPLPSWPTIALWIYGEGRCLVDFKFASGVLRRGSGIWRTCILEWACTNLEVPAGAWVPWCCCPHLWATISTQTLRLFWVALNSSSSQASQMVDLVITLLHQLAPRSEVILQHSDRKDYLQVF